MSDGGIIMEKGLIKKVLLALVILSFAGVAAVTAADVPASINLKDAWSASLDSKTTQKAVIFDHALHQKDGKCTDCHATDQGGKFTPPGEIKGMNDKNAAHKFCWTTCHEEKKVSVKKVCTKCHTKA